MTVRRIDLAIPLCHHCRHRDECTCFNPHVGICVGGSMSYKADHEERARLKRLRDLRVREYAGSFAKIPPSQFAFRAKVGKLDWMPPGNATRWENGHERRYDEKSDMWIKHCELCGERFEAYTEYRRLCSQCHDEVCEKMGIDYSQVQLPHKPRKGKNHE